MSNAALALHERRAEPRTPTNAPARILHGANLALWADCAIKDLSQSGAKLAVSHFHNLPPRFVLLSLHAGEAIDVVMKWRRGDLAGVAFEKRHALENLEDPRLAPARETWLALRPGIAPPPGPSPTPEGGAGPQTKPG
jgi:hypothetical protein